MTTAATTPTRTRRGAPPGAYSATYRLLLRNVATRGRLAAIGALGVVTMVTAGVLGSSHLVSPLRTGTRFVDGGLIIFVPVGALVFASGAIGDLIDDGTLVYLWLRPVPARVTVLAAFAAAVTICLPMIGIPLVVSAALIDGSADLVRGTAEAVGVGVLAYSAVFTMWGVRIRRALPWGLAYILIWEGFVASAGRTASKLALRAYTRSILSDTTGIGLKLAEFTALTGVVVPLVVGALCLTYACRHLARKDVA